MNQSAVRKLTSTRLGQSPELSPSSALRVFIASKLWGQNVGLSVGGEPVMLPPETFYNHIDRTLPKQAEDTAALLSARIRLNLVRAHMVQFERPYLFALAIAFIVFAVAFNPLSADNFRHLMASASY